MTQNVGLVTGALALLSLAAMWMEPQDVAKERLRVALKDHEVRGPWIYDDIQKGLAQAQESGKPLMVVFR